MPLQFQENRTPGARLNFNANPRARMASVVSIDWDHITDKPGDIGYIGFFLDATTDIGSTTVPSDVNAIRTAGYAAYNDGGGAHFVRAASEPSHNGKAQSVDGAWWEIADIFLNPRMFGAKGDDSTDDSTAMQSWLGCVYARDAIGYIDGGEYKFGTALTASSPISITGAGREVAILKYTATTGDGITFTGTGRLALSNFSYEGPASAGVATSTAGNLLVVTAASSAWNNGASFRDIEFAYGYVELNIKRGAHWVIEGCHFGGGDPNTRAPASTHLIVANSENFDWGDGTIEGSYFQGTGTETAILHQSGGGLKVNGCRIINVGTAFNHTPAGGTVNCDQLLFSNVSFDGNTNNIVLNQGSGGVLNTVVVTGGVMFTNGGGGYNFTDDANTAWVYNVSIVGTVMGVGASDTSIRLLNVTTANLSPSIIAGPGASGTGISIGSGTSNVTVDPSIQFNGLGTNISNSSTSYRNLNSPMVAKNSSAPGTPATGYASVYTDSADGRLKAKNEAGVISTTVIAATAAAGNFFNSLSASGVLGEGVALTETVNAQTGTSYAILDGDRGKLITASNAAAQAYSIAQAGAASAFAAGWYVDIYNKSTNTSGIVTVTPTTSTIDGAATLVIPPGSGVRIVSDGTNYQVARKQGVLFVTRQIFTGSGTYTRRPGLLYAKVTCLGGGGGGGGTAGTSANLYAGAGGGAGSEAYAWLSAATIGASQTVTIGAAGAASSAGNNPGGDGGDSSFGSLCVGKGGTGGGGASSASLGAPGSGGVAGTGDITTTGAPGNTGFYSTVVTALIYSGNGGSSRFGGGAKGVGIGSNNGNAGAGYGSGGGGALANNTTNTYTGGAGTAGLVIVEEYSTQ
jgi:hypothetical protein